MIKSRFSVKLTFLAILFLMTTLFAVWSDERTTPIDVFIVIDKSLSMEYKIQAVQDYIVNLLDTKLQAGDNLTILAFYGEAKTVYSATIQNEAHKTAIKKKIMSIPADGFFTNIGEALDLLDVQIQPFSQDNHRKILVLFTDGRHNPQPNSKYGDPTSYLKHKLLQVSREEIMGDWKVIWLGIGKETSLDLAKDFSGQYIELPENVTTEDIMEATKEIIGTIGLTQDAVISKVDNKGQAVLTLTLKTDLYSEDFELTIDSIVFETPLSITANLLTQEFRRMIPKSGAITLQIPLDFSSSLAKFGPGDYKGNIKLNFTSQEKFASVLPVKLHVNSFFENYPYLLALIIFGALLVLLLLVLLVLKLLKGSAFRFKMLVKEHPLRSGMDVFTIRSSQNLYLMESMDIFKLMPNKSSRSLAELNFKSKQVNLTVLDQERFVSPKKLYDNIIGTTLTVRTEMGDEFHIKFEAL